MITQLTIKVNIMFKRIKFYTPEMIAAIQKYADDHFNGNYTLAVNKLLEKGLAADE